MHIVVRQRGGRWRGPADRGVTTAEYAVCLITACAFAALLGRILGGDAVTQELADLVGRALRQAG